MAVSTLWSNFREIFSLPWSQLLNPVTPAPNVSPGCLTYLLSFSDCVSAGSLICMQYATRVTIAIFFAVLDLSRSSTAEMAGTTVNKGVLNIYMPNGSCNAVKYMEGTDVNAVVQLVVSRLGHGPRVHARSYALYLRHTDTTKVTAALKLCLSPPLPRSYLLSLPLPPSIELSPI